MIVRLLSYCKFGYVFAVNSSPRQILPKANANLSSPCSNPNLNHKELTATQASDSVDSLITVS